MPRYFRAGQRLWETIEMAKIGTNYKKIRELRKEKAAGIPRKKIDWKQIGLAVYAKENVTL